MAQGKPVASVVVAAAAATACGRASLQELSVAAYTGRNILGGIKNNSIQKKYRAVYR